MSGKRLKSVLFFLGVAVAFAAVAGYVVLSHPMFGRQPRGERLKRLRASPNYANGAFVNLVSRPYMPEGSMLKNAWNFLFRKKERSRPSGPLPSVKTDPASLLSTRDTVIWLGHSSLFMQLVGKKFLVDPNFTPYASPFTWITRSFNGTDLYAADDFPFVDCLLLTHDHYDHLNYETIAGLKDKVGLVVCGLGVGEHLEYWGVPASKIVEMDWDEAITLDEGVTLRCLSAHHFSGRTPWSFNTTLWVSYVLETPSLKLYLGGDSGYGPHFAEAGKRFGPFDIALLECGQYDPAWKYNHMRPEETLQAAKDLRAKGLLPIHAGRFVLANHAWDEPYRLLAGLPQSGDVRLITPVIGEPVFLQETEQEFTKWWEGIE